MKNVVPAVKGTRDFFPEEMAVRTWLYNTMREVSELFGYQEYEAPLIETLELYAAKSGDELVKEQSFVFHDRGGDQITLRPEMTPSLSRMVAQRQKQLVYPLRWWSFGPFWRYERPQKGRTREFYQWNVDLLGVDTPEADAEVIAVLASFFKKVGLTPGQVVILVNNRRLTDVKLTALGVPQEKKANVSNLIDRRNKMEPSEWDAYALDIGLDREQLAHLKGILEDQDLWKEWPDLVRLMEVLEAIGVKDYIRFDPSVIRGLLYYTGTVFEAYELSGEIRRSIMGGGRYDNLLSDVGGEPLPAVGFAVGDVIISLLLEKLGLIPHSLGRSPASVLVTVFDSERAMDSQSLAADLRLAGLKVVCYPEASKLARQLKYADRIGIRLALVLGPDEQTRGQVTIKDLASGNQQTVARSEAASIIHELLESNS